MGLFKRPLLAVIAVLALALIGAGCGGGDEDTSTSSGAATTTAAAQSDGDAGGIKVAKKTIGVVDLIRQSPIDDKTDRVIEAAGELLGWDIKVSDAGGDPQKVAQMTQAFVDAKVDGLILTSIDANLVRQQLTQAKTAGIPVIHTASGTKESDLWAAAYAEDETKMAAMLVQYIIDNAEKPPAKILDLRTNLNYAGAVREQAVQDTVKAAGPSKAVILGTADVDLSNPVVNAQKDTTDLLTAHPDATAVYAVFDNMAQAAVTAVKLKRSDAKVYSYFTTEQNVKNLQSDTPLEAVMDVDLAKTGAVAIDQLLQYFEKQTPIDPNAMDDYPLEYRVIDREVIKTLGASGDPFPIDKTLAPFQEKWAKEFPAS